MLRQMPRARLFRALLLLASGAALLTAAGCLTDEPSVARLVNDQGIDVRLRLCSSNDCRDGFSPPDETLRPGEDWDVNVSISGVPNVYVVESPDEKVRYGCLPLVTPSRRPKMTVRTSEHVPCPSHVDEDEFWPRRWGDQS